VLSQSIDKSFWVEEASTIPVKGKLLYISQRERFFSALVFLAVKCTSEAMDFL